MNMTRPNPNDPAATHKKPGPPPTPKTLIAKIESALDRIENHTDAIYQTAQVPAKSQTNLHRHARQFQKLYHIIRRDLAELRARIAHQKPESSPQNRPAAPTSRSRRLKLYADETAQRVIAATYGPSHSEPDHSTETRTT